MKIVRTIIFLLCLPNVALVPTTSDNQTIELNFLSNEITQCLDTLKKASQDFEQKYGDTSKLICTTCKEKKLAYGEITGWVLARFLESCADKNKFDTTKKMLIETSNGLSQKTPDELLDFMLRMANDLQVSCSHCQAKHWRIVD